MYNAGKLGQDHMFLLDPSQPEAPLSDPQLAGQRPLAWNHWNHWKPMDLDLTLPGLVNVYITNWKITIFNG